MKTPVACPVCGMMGNVEIEFSRGLFTNPVLVLVDGDHDCYETCEPDEDVLVAAAAAVLGLEPDEEEEDADAAWQARRDAWDDHQYEFRAGK